MCVCRLCVCELCRRRSRADFIWPNPRSLACVRHPAATTLVGRRGVSRPRYITLYPTRMPYITLYIICICRPLLQLHPLVRGSQVFRPASVKIYLLWFDDACTSTIYDRVLTSVILYTCTDTIYELPASFAVRVHCARYIMRWKII